MDSLAMEHIVKILTNAQLAMIAMPMQIVIMSMEVSTVFVSAATQETESLALILMSAWKDQFSVVREVMMDAKKYQWQHTVTDHSRWIHVTHYVNSRVGALASFC
jgi:hypothetical protein